MIGVSGGRRVLLATQPIDFRKGMDTLAALVAEVLKADPFCGDVFIFRPKRCDRLKLLVWDGPPPEAALFSLKQMLWGERRTG
jgi:transposase